MKALTAVEVDEVHPQGFFLGAGISQQVESFPVAVIMADID